MIDNPDCPACRANAWDVFGTRVYEAATLATLPESNRLVLSVLFERWVPGAEQVEVKLKGCRDCGMMIFTPRPSDADIQSKYAYLVASIGDATPGRGEAPARTRLRAARLHHIVAPHLDPGGGTRAILDFGGGDGRLVAQFVANGDACHVLDYTSRPIAGVTRLGDNQDALRPEHMYDLIVCSHVVEHLATPIAILSTLKSHLRPNGVIYVEVPMEVYRFLPARSEPVTHQNFFTPASLRTLLETSGLAVKSSRLMYYPHPHGGWKLAVGAIAHLPSDSLTVSRRGLGELRSYLNPSLLRKLRVRIIKQRDQSRLREA